MPSPTAAALQTPSSTAQLPSPPAAVLLPAIVSSPSAEVQLMPTVVSSPPIAVLSPPAVVSNVLLSPIAAPLSPGLNDSGIGLLVGE